MREFFRGWRRKAGCVVLAWACAFMGWWVRSVTVTDEFIPPGKLIPLCRSKIIIASTPRGLEIEKSWSDNKGANYSIPNGQYRSFENDFWWYRNSHIRRTDRDPVIDRKGSLC